MKDAKYSLDIMRQHIESKYISPENKYAFSTSIEALEKQVPKEPDHIPCDKWGKMRPICPICHSKIDGYLKDVYCHECGQALKWSDSDE